jgi:16S rRNA (guanine966-N2)-methyltransferase
VVLAPDVALYGFGVRVVAGSARGLTLVAPPGKATRPTSDRTREAIFSILTSLDAIDDAVVVDLFAGSGALGIEALSRGAAKAYFVDNNSDALGAIRANLAKTHLEPLGAVVRSDAAKWLAAHASEVSLVLADPPYAFDGWGELLAQIPNALVVAESDRAIDPPQGWETVRERRYGTTVVSVFARQSDPTTSS